MKVEFEIIPGKIAITPCLMIGGKEIGLLWICFLAYIDFEKEGKEG